MAAMTSSFVGSTSAFQAQVSAPRVGNVRAVACSIVAFKTPLCNEYQSVMEAEYDTAL